MKNGQHTLALYRVQCSVLSKLNCIKDNWTITSDFLKNIYKHGQHTFTLYKVQCSVLCVIDISKDTSRLITISWQSTTRAIHFRIKMLCIVRESFHSRSRPSSHLYLCSNLNSSTNIPIHWVPVFAQWHTFTQTRNSSQQFYNHVHWKLSTDVQFNTLNNYKDVTTIISSSITDIQMYVLQYSRTWGSLSS